MSVFQYVNKIKGEEIPKQIMDDLRSAKTLIEVLKVKPGQIETAAKVECYLSSVESYLIITAKEKFGDKYVKNWVKKIEEAKKVVYAEIAHAIADRRKYGNYIKILKYLGQHGEITLTKAAEIINQITRLSYEALNDHEINNRRKKEGKPPANIILVRGGGIAKQIPSFKEKWGFRPAFIAAGALYPIANTVLRPEFAGLAMALSSVSVTGNALTLKRLSFKLKHARTS